jgi:mannose-6-phosphate isomerase-like protein (cupin superfamily)
MKVVDKPWGREEWLELNDRYCCKRIYINKGYRTSFQYHNFKVETNCLISGIAELWLENNDGEIEKTIIKGGDFFNVHPPKKHRLIALTDLILYESSTPEVDDVIRIQDDANRGDGKILEEHQMISNKEILSDPKDINEVTYKVNDRVFKFNQNLEISQRLFESSKRISKYLPQNIDFDDFIISYDWVDGEILYKIDEFTIYHDFLSFFQEMISSSSKYFDDENVIGFYKEKNTVRKKLFVSKYGTEKLSKKFTINGNECSSIEYLLDNLKRKKN